MARCNRDNREEKRERIIERLVGGCDLPPELLHGGCYVEMRGRNRVTVRGCKKIVRYSTEDIILKMKCDFLEIHGKRLCCLTYFSGAVVIEGIVDSIAFIKTFDGEAR